MISHRIVPEGKSLDECCRQLEAAHREDRSFIFGYVPDNDGDRGNIVYYDEEKKGARAIQAQEVFALACAAELACLALSEHRGKLHPHRQAVVVNGPTSLRIERIAEHFGVEVHRAEVGEANVVGLAAELRSAGVEVRILGEGSNGGNITHPSLIRDPLSTIFSLLKLLFLGARDASHSPLAEWCRRAELPPPPFPALPPSLGYPLRSLPKFLSLSAFEPEALMKIRTLDQKRFKARYEKIFLREWDRRHGVLRERH
jgi:phosphoglucomutase